MIWSSYLEDLTFYYFPLYPSVLDALASLHFLKRISNTPTPGGLYLLFPLLQMLFQQILLQLAPPPPSGLFKCHVLREA